MKGTQLGELEELVLLTVAALFDDAYGISIMQEIEKQTGAINYDQHRACRSQATGRKGICRLQIRRLHQ